MNFRAFCCFPLLLLLAAPVSVTASEAIPSPAEFAGFPIGSDGNLVRWERIVEYFELLAGRSERVRVQELTRTHLGNPLILAILSSPQNLAQLDQIRQTQRRLAYPYDLSEQQTQNLAWESPAVVLMTCNIHATEIASSQMALEAAYRMATEDSRWMRQVLDNVVFLLVPSFNPDGQIMVVDWNNRVRGAEHVWSPLPWLYHPYVGHDNNRDAYMMTQPESRAVNKLLFQDWFPQVYLDQHQQGNTGMRIFVPPFRNPINPNVDPIVWSEIGLIGFTMFRDLHQAGFRGVGYDQKYTAWWQGGFLRGAWFHNMAGLLTEVASANLASPVYQQQAELGKPPNNAGGFSEWYEERVKNPEAPMPPPRDVVPRNNYPRPWLGGKWTLRDIVDAELVITNALLEAAANNRVRLIENQVKMGQAAIEAGNNDAPFAYVFPPKQHDPGAAHRLLEVLHFAGIEVHRAEESFTADGKSYAAGSFVIRMAQPFRAYVKDLLEPQQHPDPSDLPQGAMGDQPYDVTAWTLPLQMGVEAVAVQDAFEAALEKLSSIPTPELAWNVSNEPRHGFLVRPGPNARSRLTNRLLAQGAQVAWTPFEVAVGGDTVLPGALWVRGVGAEKLRELSQGSGLTVDAAPASLAESSAGLMPLRSPRVALYRPWTASMDEGWTRWLLEQYEFRFTPVFDADLRAGGLEDHWDAVILPGDRSDAQLIEGHSSKAVPEKYRGGFGEEGRTALRRFVARGGTLITMGDSTEFALRTFELPLKSAVDTVPRTRFSCPGSFLRIAVDRSQPVGFGMNEAAIAVFEDSEAFTMIPGFSFTDLRVIARYEGVDLLASGWIRGPEHLHDQIAAAEVAYKKGRVVLIGFRPQFRAQPHNTFPLLFNAIHLAGAKAASE